MRFIGDAATRIAEDYLRILRFFRFHASYGSGAPDPEGVAACIAGRAGLDQLSRERIRMELIKLLLARQPVPALATMTETGLLEQVLGGVPLLASYAKMIELEAMLALAPDAAAGSARWQSRCSRTSSACASVCGSPMRNTSGLASMAEGWWHVSCSLANGRRASALSPGAPAFHRPRAAGLDALAARCGGRRWRAARDFAGALGPPAFPLKAADFLARGVPKGPRLGAALAAAEEAWIAAGFPTDAAALAATADAAVGQA